MKEKIEALKLGLQVIVYCALIVLIGSLFVKPEFTAKRTGDFFKAFQAHDINIKIAALGFNISAQEVKELVQQTAVLDQAQVAASCLADGDCDQAQQRDLAKILQVSKVEEYLTPPVVVSDDDGLNSAIVTRDDSRDWVIVTGADRTEEAARDEVNRIAPLAQVPDTGLIRRDGWYRTVAFFPTAEAAEAAVEAVRRAARSDAVYVRSTQIWCEGRAELVERDIYACGN